MNTAVKPSRIGLYVGLCFACLAGCNGVESSETDTGWEDAAEDIGIDHIINDQDLLIEDMVQPVDELSVENEHLRLTFRLATEADNDTIARLILLSATNLGTEEVVDLSDSPLWQLELRDQTNREQRMLLPSDEDLAEASPPWRPIDTVSMTDANGDIVLEWENIPIGDTDATVSVTATVGVDVDGFIAWDVEAWVEGSESIFIEGLRYPIVLVPPLSGEGSDDSLLLPFKQGVVISNPIANGNPYDDDIYSQVEAQVFYYPGGMSTQLMALYDDTFGGLYMATHDPAGYVKRYFFDSIDNRLCLYVTHINTVESDDALTQAASLPLASRFGYTVAMDGFVGGWRDAAFIYRDWLEGSSTEFLSEGRLADRADISETIQAAPYSVVYVNAGSVEPLDSDRDYARIAQLLDDMATGFEGVLPNPVVWMPKSTLTGLGNDCRPSFLRENGALLIDRLYEDLGVQTLYNADHGGWRIEAEGDDTFCMDTYESDHVDLRAIVRMADMSLLNRHHEQHNMRTCSGSQWLADRRVDNVVAAFEDSRDLGGGESGHGYSVFFSSGSGTSVQPCYAGLWPTTDLDSHDHPLGGGVFHTEGELYVSEALQSALGVSAPLNEHTNEAMTTGYLQGGHAAVGPFDDGFVGMLEAGTWIPGAEPVPLMATIFHEYNLISSAGTYWWPMTVDHSPEELNYRMHQARTVIEFGKIPNIVLVTDDLVGTEPYNTGTDGLLSERETFSSHSYDDFVYARSLIHLRAWASDYLAFGRSVVPPEVTALSEDMVFNRWGSSETLAIQTVVSAAWQYDESVGFPVSNFTRDAQTIDLCVDASLYSISGTGQYLLERLSPSADPALLASGNGPTLCTEDLTLEAGETAMFRLMHE